MFARTELQELELWDDFIDPTDLLGIGNPLASDSSVLFQFADVTGSFTRGVLTSRPIAGTMDLVIFAACHLDPERWVSPEKTTAVVPGFFSLVRSKRPIDPAHPLNFAPDRSFLFWWFPPFWGGSR
jgi:hypothetical protein